VLCRDAACHVSTVHPLMIYGTSARSYVCRNPIQTNQGNHLITQIIVQTVAPFRPKRDSFIGEHLSADGLACLIISTIILLAMRFAPGWSRWFLFSRFPFSLFLFPFIQSFSLSVFQFLCVIRSTDPVANTIHNAILFLIPQVHGSPIAIFIIAAL